MRRPLQSFIGYLRDQRVYSPNTVDCYTRDIMQFAEFTKRFIKSDVDVSNIEPEEVRAFLAQLVRNGLGDSSVARKLASLKSFFKYLVREEVIKHNPGAGLKYPKKRRRLLIQKKD